MACHCFNAHILLPIALLALISTTLAFEDSKKGQSTKLRPININDYEAAMGLQRRSAEEFSNLNPQAQSELIYGSPGGTFLSY